MIEFKFEVLLEAKSLQECSSRRLTVLTKMLIKSGLRPLSTYPSSFILVEEPIVVLSTMWYRDLRAYGINAQGCVD